MRHLETTAPSSRRTMRQDSLPPGKSLQNAHTPGSMNLAAVGRLLRTIRHLRPRQIGSQVVHRLRRNRSGPRRAPSPERMPEIRWADEVIVPPPPAAGAHDRATLLAGSVTFQNRTEAMGFPPDWGLTGLPLLWRYHLHYHEFLWCLGFADARLAALHWIEHHGPGRGQVGWEPYPTSLRLANWCALFLGRHREQTLADPVLAANCGRASGRRRTICNGAWSGISLAIICSRTEPRWRSRGVASRIPTRNRGCGPESGCSIASCPSRCLPTAGTSSARRCTSSASCTVCGCSPRP